MSEENCNATMFPLKKYIYMPPQESLIAKLLRKQTKVEQAEHETSASPNAMKSCYYNLDLQVGHDLQLPQSIIHTSANISDQSLNSAQNIQKTTSSDSDTLTNPQSYSERNTYQHSLSNTNIFREFLEFNNSSSAELPTDCSRDSLDSHDAFEIFAWNQKKKWENSEETSTFGTTSEYCYCSNNSQSY
ncbi:hypothetical protein X798_04431 [Onchocerca flexuosa]|uniref:Uncharacterized protein n=1 Tax=Onchocerca flexuosa TaxID=387005 RepID=A0A238BT19_9BILA|nr:hypothetical protein X798_04431 [Onchocerca flexuosa]